MKYSLVIPVYKNESCLPRLIAALEQLNTELECSLEVVFVVDGSPDNCYAKLAEGLPNFPFAARLLAHSRNFGSFPAIRTGLAAATGQYFAVMAADLQEPPELIKTFFRHLENDECDVVIGTRSARNDPLAHRAASELFWSIYRRLVVREMPPGGVDIFGCNKAFCERLLELEEARSSLIALIFWLGFRRKQVDYERLAREEGKSAWTLRKKIDYMMDSVFAFTDLPVRLIMHAGVAGMGLSLVVGAVVLAWRLAGLTDVPGYTPIVLLILFFGALNMFCLGLVGTYAWRTYENTKSRPLAVVMSSRSNREPDQPPC